MSTRIFTIIEKCFKTAPVKTAILTLPILVIASGTIQSKLGILPKNSIYSYSEKIFTEEFGLYNSPK